MSAFIKKYDSSDAVRGVYFFCSILISFPCTCGPSEFNHLTHTILHLFWMLNSQRMYHPHHNWYV
jgi:hypothetical protein